MLGPASAVREPRLVDHFGVADEPQHPLSDGVGTGRDGQPVAVLRLVSVARCVVERPVAGAVLVDAELVGIAVGLTRITPSSLEIASQPESEI